MDCRAVVNISYSAPVRRLFYGLTCGKLKINIISVSIRENEVVVVNLVAYYPVGFY